MEAAAIMAIALANGGVMASAYALRMSICLWHLLSFPNLC